MGKNTVAITFKIDGDNKEFKVLANDAEGLKKAMSAALVESGKMKQSLFSWSAAVQGIESISNAVGQLNATLQQFTAESGEFNTAMKEANTMALKGAEDFEKLKEAVANVSKEVPVARDLLAKGLYQVISNGVPEENWMKFLEDSAKSSVGGLANLEKVVTVTSTVIKNYGLAWSDAQAVQDKIQLTAKNGVTSFEQLAEALPRVTGSASNLGVSLNELLAVFATTTGVTGNTAEVSTQLAAVLSALTKPSAEAGKAAEAMGIQFDAAAVKSAGGLKNFLQMLDMSITMYANKTGQLKETIYATLFGSAESLRLLTALTGKQAEKFTENVRSMVDSAGTMDEAYKIGASTGEAMRTNLKNQTSSVRDLVSSMVGTASPFIDFASNAGITAMSIAALSKTMKYNTAAIKANNLITRLSIGTLRIFSTTAKTTDAAVLASSRSVKALNIAMKALAPVAIIAGITAVASALSKVNDKAEETKEKIQEVKEAEDTFTETFSKARVELDNEIKKLGDLIKAKKETTSAIAHLNDKYGESFGVHKTASDWYDTLIKKSQAYCLQLGYEAKMKVLSEKMAAKQIQLEVEKARKKALEDSGKAQRGTVQNVTMGSTIGANMAGGTIEMVDTSEYREAKQNISGLSSDLSQLQEEWNVTSELMEQNAAGLNDLLNNQNNIVKVSEMNWNQVSKAISETEEKLKSTTDPKTIASLKAYNQQLKERKSLLDETLGLANKGSQNGNKVTTQPLNLSPLPTLSIDAPDLSFSTDLDKMIQGLTLSFREMKVEMIDAFSTMQNGWGSVKGIAGGIQGITDALSGNGNAWQRICGLMDGFFSLYENINHIIEIVNMLTAATEMQAMAEQGKAIIKTKGAATDTAVTAIEVANSAARATAAGTEAAADMTAATAKVLKAHAFIPFVGVAIGAAMIGTMIAMMSKAKSSVPKFANGGIIKGPTIGLMGEYSGASHNPEVVAPLDKLKTYMTNQNGFGEVEFKIKGRDLVGILNKEDNFKRRS